MRRLTLVFAALFLFAHTAFATSYAQFSQTMKSSGVILRNATARVTQAGSLVTIYSDAGVTPISNPTTTNGSGVLTFYAAYGSYKIVVGDSVTYITLPITTAALQGDKNKCIPVSGGQVEQWDTAGNASCITTPSGGGGVTPTPGGQTLIGGTGAGDPLTLQSTNNATRGNVIVDGDTFKMKCESGTPNGRMLDLYDSTGALVFYWACGGTLHAYGTGSGFEVNVSNGAYAAGSTGIIYGFIGDSRMVPTTTTGLAFYAGNTQTAGVSANGLQTKVVTDTLPGTCVASPADIVVDVGTVKRICVCTATNTFKCATLS